MKWSRRAAQVRGCEATSVPLPAGRRSGEVYTYTRPGLGHAVSTCSGGRKDPQTPKVKVK